MECSECGTQEGHIEEFTLNFEVKNKNVGVYKAEFSRPLCKKCLLLNINTLNSDLKFEHDSDPDAKGKLNIFINEDFIKIS